MLALAGVSVLVAAPIVGAVNGLWSIAVAPDLPTAVKVIVFALAATFTGAIGVLITERAGFR